MKNDAGRQRALGDYAEVGLAFPHRFDSLRGHAADQSELYTRVVARKPLDDTRKQVELRDIL